MKSQTFVEYYILIRDFVWGEGMIKRVLFCNVGDETF